MTEAAKMSPKILNFCSSAWTASPFSTLSIFSVRLAFVLFLSTSCGAVIRGGVLGVTGFRVCAFFVFFAFSAFLAVGAFFVVGAFFLRGRISANAAQGAINSC